MMVIEEPVVLAKLPKALQENSQNKYGHVYSLAAGQKKKRHEVTVAIDGNSVNIYEIEHGSIKASYAIPPTASFLANPVSIRVKASKHSYTRYTYCVTRRQASQRLDCFEEIFENGQSHGVVGYSAVLENDSDIAHVEIVPGSEAFKDDPTQHRIQLLHQNGNLRIYSSNIRHREASIQLDQLVAAKNKTLLAARWLTFEDVRDYTLKHRPDLLASTDSASTFISVLYVERSGADATAHVGIWSIPQARATSSGSQILRTLAVVIYNLPGSQIFAQEAETECLFNPKATSLLVTGVKAVASYDFSSYSPRMTWERQISNHGLSSVRLSNSFVATSTTTSLTIFDTRFNSTRTKLDLTRIGRKRKREGESAVIRGYVKIIGYFRELGKLVTVRRNHLLSFEISGDQKEAFLIDSIGFEGSELHKVPKTPSLELEIGAVDDLAGLSPRQWSSLQQAMTQTAEANDAAGFESAALKAIQNPDSLDQLSDHQVEFLLSRIFRCANDVMPGNEGVRLASYCLQVALPAYTLITMLIEHGVVTRYNLQQALRAVPQNGTAPRVRAGMISAALIESDRSFSLLKIWLENARWLDAAELAATVGSLVDLLYAEIYTLATESPDPTLLNDRNFMDVEADSSLDKQLARVPSLDGPKPEQASVKSILITVLERLAGYGSSVIAEGLKSSLDHTKTLMLIQLLRQQLFEGHHTTFVMQTTYPSPPPSAHSSIEEQTPALVLSLESTSKVLLGCIDAIGPLGFLGTENGQGDFISRLVPELKSETELATQGLEDTIILRGILRETMRYAESADKDAFSSDSTALVEQTAPVQQKPGTIVTIYSEPSVEQGDIETTRGMLPLSLHAENTVTLMKRRKGGGQVKDRTLREVREMENRNKGVYSFERLVL